MIRFRLIPVIATMLIYYIDCSGQSYRNEMIHYYKKVFLYQCMQPFENDTSYRDEVCSYSIDWIDKGSLMELDSMCKLVKDEINMDVQIINEDSSGSYYPSRICVLHYCLNQYDSRDMDKMAKGFARRMKKVRPTTFYNY